jgi:hypothetical protein
MTPREVMKRAIEFRNPPRLAINGFGDASDVIWIGADDIRPPQAQADPGLDQWLCRWAHTDVPNMGQVKGHPLEDWSRLPTYPWPDGADPRRTANMPARLNDVDANPVQRDKYRICSIFMLLWERMQALHGFENCMMDMMDDRPEIHDLADRLVAYDIAFIRNVHRVAGDRIDCFNFSEDWGTEQDLMVSPELFRSFFAPRYKRIFDAAHECGWHVWMHSCGKINKAIPILIEVGVDALNMQQPVTNGIEEIGRDFAGRICFETLCDIQKTLPAGNRDVIEQEAIALMRQWGTPDGGFVLGDYGDHRAIGADPQVKQFMLDAFRRLDPWRAAQ